MTGSLRERVGRLKELAGSLNVKGDTNEQSLLLAIIDALNEFAEILDKHCESAQACEQPYILNSQCPNCGKAINLNISSLHSHEPVVCENCHEIIGVISDYIIE